MILNPNGGVADNQPQADESLYNAKMAEWIKNSENIYCEECGGKNFINVFRLKKLSGLMTGTGKDMLIPVSTLACADCGKVPDKLLEKIGDENKE